MSHFYAVVKGNRGEATRCGSKGSGIRTVAASWSGAIETILFEKDGVDMYRVVQTSWKGSGVYRVIAEGEVGL